MDESMDGAMRCDAMWMWLEWSGRLWSWRHERCDGKCNRVRAYCGQSECMKYNQMRDGEDEY